MLIGLLTILLFFFFYIHGDHPDLHSFPTRRSSDLSRKLLPVWCRKRFSRLGSEICTSCSSTPEAEARCATSGRSEEHTSELQSRLHLVCRLLLEKKKTNTYSTSNV